MSGQKPGRCCTSTPTRWRSSTSRATGDRSKVERSRGVGKTVVIGVCDDHTRLAYCELHSAENAANVSATLKRAASWFTEQGCGPVQAVMSDNAKCYSTSREFRQALDEL